VATLLSRSGDASYVTETKMMPDISKINIERLLGKVKNPLGFFVLALLVCFVVMLTAIVAGWPFLAGAMTALMICDILVVAAITLRAPDNFYEELRDAKSVKEFINSKGFRDVVEDAVQRILEKK
jgi:uncharacterized OsmC-like protein